MALQYGLINYMVSQEELLNKARSILAIINSKAPLAVAACIKAANAVFDETKNGLALEVELFGQLFDTADAKEGNCRILRKTKSKLRGKADHFLLLDQSFINKEYRHF
jgi:enoyl-CoA hydratase